MNAQHQNLLARIEAEETIDYLFFWGHRKNRDGSDGKGTLSQWYPSEFTVDGLTFPTAEHWMMYQKATLFNDAFAMERVFKKPSPEFAKKVGREVKNFNQRTWTANAYEIVVAGNRHKFEQNEGMKNFLLATNGKVLVEASPVDNIWGIGLVESDNRARDPNQWKGTNLLGFALMDVREKLL